MPDVLPLAPAPSRTTTPPRQLDAALVWLMALTCGLVVANIYYNQPLLVAIGRTFHISDSRASLVATATQIGYTLGMVLVVPLGDMLERKNLIIWMLLAAVGCLGAAAFAPTFGLLAVASVLIGICSSVPQLLLPMAATLAPEADRGRIVGRVMSGLLIGILLSRTLSGYVGAHLGWRVVFEGAAGLMLALAALLAWRLPRNRPAFAGSYTSLMQSLLTLTRELPDLRRSALVGAAIFASFSVFWTTLAFYLASPAYHYGSDVAGFFGLIGALGALAAPLAGKVADTRGPRYAITVGVALALGAYLLLGVGGGYL
ncbi:MAG: MFS transporter, partial [Hymenobacter sp.]